MVFFLGKSCHWLSVDTALYILKENETQENLQLVSFTEQQNKEVRYFCCSPILIVIPLVYVLMLHGWVPSVWKEFKLYLIRLKERRNTSVHVLFQNWQNLHEVRCNTVLVYALWAELQAIEA